MKIGCYKIHFFTLCLLFSGVFYNAQSKSSIVINRLKDSVNISKHKNGEKLFYKTVSDGGDNYSIEIRTAYIYDKAYLTHDWVSDINNVVTSQTLIFKYKDSIIAKKNFDVRKRTIKKSNKKVSFLDNVIREVGVVKGLNGSFYKIYGFGGCNACSEYLGYYSMKGDLLYKIYSSRMDNFNCNYGNFKHMIDKYGIPEKDLKANTLKVISVFPPQFSGNIDKASIR